MKIKNNFKMMVAAAACLSLAACGGRQVAEQGPGESAVRFEMPFTALRLLADAGIDPCPVCAEKFVKRAFQLLDTDFPPGRTIELGEQCGFLVSGECGANEFVPSCQGQRPPYRKDAKGKETRLPLVVFRFHTAKRHLVGISDKDFTSDAMERSFFSRGRGRPFSGRVAVVSYKYGDGAGTMYNRKENRLLIHCQLLEIR